MATTEAYVECHFYSAGLKSKYFGHVPRPAYLPSHESVGLRNEALLREEDYCVEFLRRRCGDRRVAWLAVHVPAVDAAYGDRGNNCAVGVWFVDASPCTIYKLLSALMQLARVLSKQGLSDLLERNIVTFCREYLPDHLIPIEGTPPEFSGVGYSSHNYDKSDYRETVPLDSISDRLGVIATSILAACYRREQSDVNRILFFDCSSGKITASPVEPMASAQDAVVVDAVLRRQLVDASQDIARANDAEKKADEAAKAYDRLRADLGNKQAKIEQLANENAGLNHKNANLTETIEGLKRSLTEATAVGFAMDPAAEKTANSGGKKRHAGQQGVMQPQDRDSRILEELLAIRNILKRIEVAFVPAPFDVVPNTSVPWWKFWRAGSSSLYLYVALSAAAIVFCLFILFTLRQP